MPHLLVPGCFVPFAISLPATTAPGDWNWLKERSPLPIMADESYLFAKDIQCCTGCFHAVNVKLAQTGGITGAQEALQAALDAGLKTMLGCMIESSLLIDRLPGH